jgi:mRNA interferase RelE/StbE
MRYEIFLAPAAADDLRTLEAKERSAVVAAIEVHLRHEPTKVSRSRIKRLRGMRRPQYRLRVDDIRVFYDVTEDVVEVLAIVSKKHANEWLAAKGETDEGSSSVGGKG